MGITYPQYLVLLVLWEHGSRRLGDIADDLRLASHAISPIVDRLEDAGLVRRERDPADGRVIIVEITEPGAALQGKAAAVQEALRCHTALNDAEVIQLRTELIELADQLASP